MSRVVSLGQYSENCRIGGCIAKNTRSTCPMCPEWTPSRGSKYHRCKQWRELRVICDLPRSACATCPQLLPACDPAQGRPNMSGIDWNDPDQVREYNMLKKRESRRNA